MIEESLPYPNSIPQPPCGGISRSRAHGEGIVRRKDREHRAPARAGGGLRRRCADHSVTRKFKSLSGPIILSALSFPVPIDERHHRSARRPRVRRSKRPGWIKRQDHPRPRRRFAKRVARSTPIHRAETSSFKAVKIKDQVKCTIKERGGWQIVVGAKAKAWTLGELATVYAWMSSAQLFQDLCAVD